MKLTQFFQRKDFFQNFPTLERRKINKFFLKIKKTYEFFLFLAVFCIPFTKGSIIYSASFFPLGKFNHFLNYSIYPFDLFFLISLIFFFIHKYISNEKIRFGDKKTLLILSLIIITIQFSVFNSSNPKISQLNSNYFVELLLFYILIQNLSYQSIKKLLITFIASAVFQSLIAIYQFTFQGSLNLNFLGEIDVNSSQKGLAKIDLQNIKKIRPYGTFPHPNILASYLALSILISHTVINKTKRISIPLITVLTSALILTMSRSALLAILIVLIISKKKNLFIFSLISSASLLMPSIRQRISSTINDTAFIERLDQSITSFKMFIHHPFGVGINNYTLNAPHFYEHKIQPWINQPVHNLFLLSINELGIIGFILFIYLILHLLIKCKTNKRKTFNNENISFNKTSFQLIFFIFISAQFDHFLISLPSGRIIFLFIIAISAYSLNKHNFNKKITNLE